MTFSIDKIVGFDFETRCALSLPKVGTYAYADQAEAIILTYQIGAGDVRLVQREGLALTWDDLPAEFRAVYVDPEFKLTAWNAGFDRAIANYSVPGSPILPPERVLDAMAQAMASNLPAALDQASAALGGPGKQADGKKLISMFCGPNAADPKDHPEEWRRFCTYAVRDTAILGTIWRQTRALSLKEWRTYWANEALCERGMAVDLPFCQAADLLAIEAIDKAGKRLAELTGGKITSINQHIRLAQWVYDRLDQPGDNRTTEAREIMVTAILEPEERDEDDNLVEALNKISIARGIVERLRDWMDGTGYDDPVLREILELREFGASAAPKKFHAALTQASNGRLRGQIVFNGAAQTGRFSGKGVQCVTGDHEALTRHGWRRLDEIVGPCEIMAWSTDGTMRWEAGEVNGFGVPDKVAHIDGTMIRGTYTLDHRMPNRHAAGGGLVDYTPQKLLEVTKRGGFIIAGTVDQPDAPFDDVQLRLRVAMQADGHWAKRAAHWHFTKVRKIERLEMLLDEAGVPFKRRLTKEGTTKFIIATADVPSWLVKDFGPWILRLSARQAALALEEIREWDGYSHKRGHLQISSPRKDQMEWVVTMAALAGRAATLAWYTSHKSERGRWVVFVRSSVTTTLHRNEVKVADGINPVFCPTVPSGYWLCRIADRVFVTGNTQNLTRTPLGGDYGDWEAPTVDLITDGCTLDELAAFGDGEVPLRKLALVGRPMVIAPPGRTLIKSDYAQIEARGLPWLSKSADGDKLLDYFRAADADPSIPDLYIKSAAGMLKKATAAISKDERQRGKIATLACGFQGGKNALLSMAAQYRMYFTADEAQKIVTEWREANPWAPEFWGKHSSNESFGLMGAAMRAYQKPKSTQSAGRISFIFEPTYLGGTLFMRLPSGRLLTYPWCKWRDYEVKDKKTKKVLEIRSGLTFKRPGGMRAIYGGLLAENATQATCADLLREAMVVLHEGLLGDKLDMVLHAHDEICIECDDDPETIAHAVKVLEHAMTFDRPWAKGFPIAVDTTVRFYYSAAKLKGER